MKKENGVNYKKISRDLYLRDTKGDGRFLERCVPSKKVYKKEKYKHKIIDY
jgi:hypothetical protein